MKNFTQMKVFITGHRDLEYNDFLNYYIPDINNTIVSNPKADITFLVGDADGCDKFTYNYLQAVFKDIERVHVELCPHEEFGGFEEADKYMVSKANEIIASVYPDRFNSNTALNILKFFQI